METEREKMTKGKPFLTNDPQLMKDKSIARQLTAIYNSSPEDELLRSNLLRQLFGQCGEGVFIKPPFYCDYGYNIYLGTNFFANFDCVFWMLRQLKSVIIVWSDLKLVYMQLDIR